MSIKPQDPRIGRLRDQAQRYIDGLRTQLEAHHALSEKAYEQLQALREQMELRDDAIHTLNQRVSAMHDELEARASEGEELRERLTQVNALRERANEEHRFVQEQISSLSSLYVATYSLHGTADRVRVLSAIDQIIINLIGSEAYGVYELEAGVLTLATSMGIDPLQWQSLLPSNTTVAACIASERTMLQSDAGDEPKACIPLMLDGRLTGVVVIFRLLPHKSALCELDHELFDLLATHAASALSLSKLHSASARAVA